MMKAFYLTSIIGGLFFSNISSVFAKDTLIIISPHRKSIQQEFIPVFKKYYKETYKTEIQVDWLDQGGTSDDVKFVRAKFDKNPKTSGIDIFWGGGTSTFVQMDQENLLAPYNLSEELAPQIPASVAGIELYSLKKTWYSSALSSFGIFYNKFIAKIEKLPEPKLWSDLGNEKYFNNISQADPRRSGTATTMNEIIIQSLGWEKGWELLTRLSGNTKMFTHSSSDPIKAVVSGNAAIALAIDFYANPKVGELGKNKLGFVLPKGQTVLDGDPVAILKGAPNRKAAERFVEFVLNKDTQKLLILPKGSKEGPMQSTLGRMAVNTASYKETDGKRTNEFNPFNEKEFLQLDVEKAVKTRRIFTDLVGIMLIDTHKELKSAWEAVIKRGLKEADLRALAKMPMTEKEFEKIADKWEDEVFRNQKINEWVEFARQKYLKLSQNVQG